MGKQFFLICWMSIIVGCQHFIEPNCRMKIFKGNGLWKNLRESVRKVSFIDRIRSEERDENRNIELKEEVLIQEIELKEEVLIQEFEFEKIVEISPGEVHSPKIYSPLKTKQFNVKLRLCCKESINESINDLDYNITVGSKFLQNSSHPVLIMRDPEKPDKKLKGLYTSLVLDALSEKSKLITPSVLEVNYKIMIPLDCPGASLEITLIKGLVKKSTVSVDLPLINNL